MNTDKLNAFISNIDTYNYNDRKIGRSLVNGLIISTVLTSDEGYETAIGDATGHYYPVERHKDKESAIFGHQHWCEQAEAIESVRMLGWLDMDDLGEIITLKRGLKSI